MFHLTESPIEVAPGGGGWKTLRRPTICYALISKTLESLVIQLGKDSRITANPELLQCSSGGVSLAPVSFVPPFSRSLLIRSLVPSHTYASRLHHSHRGPPPAAFLGICTWVSPSFFPSDCEQHRRELAFPAAFARCASTVHLHESDLHKFRGVPCARFAPGDGKPGNTGLI